MSLVGLARIREDTRYSMKEAISRSLDLINFQFDRNIRKIVIKPNMCYYWDYSTGQTTDPRFIGALIDLIRERIPSEVAISIVESDASAMKCRHAFGLLGYTKLAEDFDVKLVNLSEDSFESTKVSVGKESFGIRLPTSIKEADLKINVPKIKYQGRHIEITCALKNIFGCNPYAKKFRYHSRLGETIIALNKALNFDVCIVDGNIVSGIQPRRLGLVMSGSDPVAIDSAAAEIAGLNSGTIKYIQLAHKEGLGNTRFNPVGVPIAYFRKGYPRRNVRQKLMGKAYYLVTSIGLGPRLGLE
jgi:uncharacterized protein (DUF362 family)